MRENGEMLRILGLSDRLLQRYEKQNTTSIYSILKHQEGLFERKHIHREEIYVAQISYEAFYWPKIWEHGDWRWKKFTK